MSKTIALGGLLALTLAGACAGGSSNDPTGEASRNATELPATITLAPGASVRVERANLNIRFDSVSSDSRCPTDVVCVHAGSATAHLTIAQLSGIMSAQLLILSTTPGQDTATAYGQPVKLLSVTPAPVSTSTIPKSSYRIELKVGADK